MAIKTTSCGPRELRSNSDSCWGRGGVWKLLDIVGLKYFKGVIFKYNLSGNKGINQPM